jgi:hypothetical protein
MLAFVYYLYNNSPPSLVLSIDLLYKFPSIVLTLHIIKPEIERP